MDGLGIVEWREICKWFKIQRQSVWAKHFSSYMEVLEQRLIDSEYLKEGTLTYFSGIPFGKDQPYNYLEAKRLLNLALGKLRQRKDLQQELGMDPEGKGRPAITGKDSEGVWDYLPILEARKAKSFTQYPHLTMYIERNGVVALVTVPNGIRREFRRKLIAGDLPEFRALFQELLDRFRHRLKSVEGATPLIDVVQRHFLSQRSEPIVDARLVFDLRAVFENKDTWGKEVKFQPQWMDLLYEMLSRKKSNIQLTVGVKFQYDSCQATRTPAILDHLAAAWIACKPLLNVAKS